MSYDPIATAQDVIDTLRGVLLGEWSKISSFATTQVKMLAIQGQLIANARVTGELREEDDLFKLFVDQLRSMTQNFARTLAAKTVLTLEKAWNAVAKVLWEAVNTVLAGAGLATLKLPGAPKA
ncbi:MAG: hypothetical protein ACK4G5_12040 [Devosia sp.]